MTTSSCLTLGTAERNAARPIGLVHVHIVMEGYGGLWLWSREVQIRMYSVPVRVGHGIQLLVGVA